MANTGHNRNFGRRQQHRVEHFFPIKSSSLIWEFKIYQVFLCMNIWIIHIFSLPDRFLKLLGMLVLRLPPLTPSSHLPDSKNDFQKVYCGLGPKTSKDPKTSKQRFQKLARWTEAEWDHCFTNNSILFQFSFSTCWISWWKKLKSFQL